MYHEVVSQCVQALKTMAVWLDKAEQYASEKQFDVGVLMTSRLAPDMRDFIYQVQSACDYVKAGAGRLSGQAPPRHEDDEKTIGDLRARLRKTIAFAESIASTQYDGAADRKIGLPWAPGKTLIGSDYLVQMIVPNTYFHVTMAYAILRHNGVELGKTDYLGPVRWIASA